MKASHTHATCTALGTGSGGRTNTSTPRGAHRRRVMGPLAPGALTATHPGSPDSAMSVIGSSNPTACTVVVLATRRPPRARTLCCPNNPTDSPVLLGGLLCVESVCVCDSVRVRVCVRVVLWLC